MSNWERRPLRKSQAHYAALDAYILIDIILKLSERAKAANRHPFEKYVKTLDTRHIIVNDIIDNEDSFYEKEKQRTQEMSDERVVADNSKHAGRQRRFNKFEENKGGDSNQNQYKSGKAAYGNSYGRKGQTNNNQIITNDNLRASMW